MSVFIDTRNGKIVVTCTREDEKSPVLIEEMPTGKLTANDLKVWEALDALDAAARATTKATLSAMSFDMTDPVIIEEPLEGEIPETSEKPAILVEAVITPGSIGTSYYKVTVGKYSAIFPILVKGVNP